MYKNKFQMRSEEDNIEAVELKQLRSELTAAERSHDQWIELFNRFDRDRDGRVSYNELRSELKNSHNIPPDVARKIMRLGDRDRDGYLELHEFLGLLRESRDVRGIFSQSVNKWVNTVCYIPRKPSLYADTIDARGQYEDQYTCWPPPLCMLAVSLIEIIIYVYDAIDRKPHQSYIQTGLAKLFIYNPHRRIDVWRFFTYMFVHIGVLHLLVNLFVQIILGIPLEMVHRWWRVLIIYLSGVVAGSLAASISDPNVFLAGASGGVYAILTAQIATVIMNWKEMEFALPQFILFMILAVVDVGTAVYNRYVLNVEDQISYVAHIAGAAAGLLIGINVLRNLEVRPWEKKLWWFSIILYTTLMLSAIIWHVTFPDYFPKQTD